MSYKIRLIQLYIRHAIRSKIEKTVNETMRTKQIKDIHMFEQKSTQKSTQKLFESTKQQLEKVAIYRAEQMAKISATKQELINSKIKSDLEEIAKIQQNIVNKTEEICKPANEEIAKIIETSKLESEKINKLHIQEIDKIKHNAKSQLDKLGDDSSHQSDEIPNSKHEIPNSKHEIPNSKHEIPNSKHEIPTFDFNELYVDGFILILGGSAITGAIITVYDVLCERDEDTFCGGASVIIFPLIGGIFAFTWPLWAIALPIGGTLKAITYFAKKDFGNSESIEICKKCGRIHD